MVFENINNIDIFGIREDGGADLVIVPNGKLDASPDTQKNLLDKIEAYLGYINSNEFHSECPQANASNTNIVLQLNEKPPKLIEELISQIDPWVAQYNANFIVQIKN